MSDEEWLYLLLLFFLVLDGVTQLPRAARYLYRTWWQQHWQIAQLSDANSLMGKGLALLPTLGTLLPVDDGFWFESSAPGADTRQLSWRAGPDRGEITVTRSNDVALWTEGNRIVGNGLVGNCVLSSHAAAEDTLAWLKPTLAAPGAITAAILERTSSALSLPRARAAVRKSRILASIFRTPEALLVVYLYLIVPVLYYYLQTSWWGLAAVLVIFILTATIAVAWWRVAGRIFPPLARWRSLRVIPVLLLPYHAIRASSHLCLQLSAGVHSLALAKVLLPKPAFDSFTAEYMRRLHYEVSQDDREMNARQDFYRRATTFLEEKCGLSANHWEEAAPVREADSHSYCPRCFAQYRQQTDTCEDCGGLRTVEFRRQSDGRKP